MKIPRYWAKGKYETQNHEGKKFVFESFGYSDSSREEALILGRQRAQGVAARFFSKQKLERYAYSDRPLREEIIEEVLFDGKKIGLVTRNSYGSFVVNTARVMFIDIDFPLVKRGFLDRLFGKKIAPPVDEYLQKLTAWQAQNQQYTLKVYRTYAGLRCLVTNTLLDPTSEESKRILEELGSDTRYVNLCKVQECYRARLTPKHWRIGAPNPKIRYPFENDSMIQKYGNWDEKYRKKCIGFTTCLILTTLGKGTVNPEVGMLMDLHDRMSCGTGELA